MVLIEDKKYACETCLKGHRSTQCRHTDRPLYEVKRKGRPVTQCEHCRELRKTKQVHVKCLCEHKEEPGVLLPGLNKKSAAAKIPTTPTFPNGVPKALEDSVVLPSPSEPSSDSDHPHERSSACACKEGEECHCCTPRKRAPRKKHPTHESRDASGSGGGSGTTSPPHSVLARVAELRPVLPRLTGADGGSSHSPSSQSPHGTTQRHHSHQNVHFSPYSRAYEHTSGEHLPHAALSQHAATLAQQGLHQSLEQYSGEEGSGSYFEGGQFDGAQQPSWIPPDFAPMCGCGDGCTCPGCFQHNPSAVNSNPEVYGQCTNPGPCVMCLECSILSLSTGPAPEGLPQSQMSELDAVFSDDGGRDIDEWIRRVSAPASDGYALPSPLPGSTSSGMDVTTGAWPGFQMPDIAEPQAGLEGGGPAPPDLCSGQCLCPRGGCACPPGCDGTHCRVTRTFTTSTERERRYPALGSALPGLPTSSDFVGSAGGLHRVPAQAPSAPGFLSVPYAGRSRSSSTSSLSSHPSSTHSTDGHRLGLQSTSRGTHTRSSSTQEAPHSVLASSSRGREAQYGEAVVPSSGDAPYASQDQLNPSLGSMRLF